MSSRDDLATHAAFAKKIDSVVDGVQFGLQSYVFSGLGLPQESILDVVVDSMVESGLGECDLFAPLLDPVRWRMTLSLDYFLAIRRKFEDAGIAVYALSGFPGSTEEELSRTFDIAETLGARLVTLNITLPAAKRVAPLAERRGFLVGIQGQPNMSSTDPDAIATPQQFEEAVKLSRNYWMSFDIGDATGGGYDSLKFVEAHHERIHLLYLKDRRKDNLSVPWGEGDTPIKDILRLIRDRKYPIRCYVDCDCATANRSADVKRSFDYAKAALG
jgi:sugar phosphate isomerase/epimerase